MVITSLGEDGQREVREATLRLKKHDAAVVGAWPTVGVIDEGGSSGAAESASHDDGAAAAALTEAAAASTFLSARARRRCAGVMKNVCGCLRSLLLPPR
jgi:hypothetical protein